jgi:hypothetical protein
VLVARQAMPQNWAGLPVLDPRQDNCGWLAPAEGLNTQRAWQPCQMLPAAQSVAWRSGPAPSGLAGAEAAAPDAAASRSATEGSVAFSPYASPASATPSTTAAATPAPVGPIGDADSGSWIGWAAGSVVAAAVGLWLALRRRGG